MRTALRASSLALLTIWMFACSSPAGSAEVSSSSVTIDGAVFEIADVAISSNCLTIAFSVRGYEPPSASFRQQGFPPAESMTVVSDPPSRLSDPVFLAGGGGGGGQEEDGRLWMRQEMHYALRAPIPEGTEVPLDITVVLNEAFEMSEPLEFRVPVVAGPGGGSCPYPGGE